MLGMHLRFCYPRRSQVAPKVTFHCNSIWDRFTAISSPLRVILFNWFARREYIIMPFFKPRFTPSGDYNA